MVENSRKWTVIGGTPPSAQLVSAAWPEWVINVDFGDDGAVTRFELLQWTGGLPRPRLADIDDAWKRAQTQPFSARLFDRLPVGAIVAEARGWLASWYRVRAEHQRDTLDSTDYSVPPREGEGRVPEPVEAERLAEMTQWAALLSARPGRRGRPVEDYVRVAVLYVEIVSATGGRSVYEVLAARLGVSKGRARSLVHDARKVHGLLTSTKQGRAGGRLTAKALRILAEVEDGTR